MKKFSKWFGTITCALVVVLSGVLMTACSAKPYDVKGVTFNAKADCFVVWGEEATQRDKDYLYEDFEATNDAELEASIEAGEAGQHFGGFTFTFNEDGLCIVSYAEGEETFYYVQSEDLKNIKLYDNAEHTGYVDFELDFVDGEFAFNASAGGDADVAIYFVLEQA